jgi:hypothetical protein
MTRQTMNQIWRTLKLGFATMALAFVFTTACGDNQPPQNPDPPPPPTPGACCQLEDKCVANDDAAACQARGGEHMENATCAENQCQQQP